MLGLNKRIVIMCGHYGSGKTNLAVNFAMDMKDAGGNVALCDVDIVNPYFRTMDGAEMLRERGVRLIAPEFANSNLDMPSLPPEIASVFEDRSVSAVFDVGGDDAGAVAMGQFSQRLEAAGYDMMLVINRHRLLTHTADALLDYVREIEAASRLRFTGIINNSNLGGETTRETVLASVEYADEASRLTGLPIVATAVRRELIDDELKKLPCIYPITILKKQDWVL